MTAVYKIKYLWQRIEVVMKLHTKVELYNNLFDVAHMKMIGSLMIPLTDVKKMKDYARVTVKAKVINILDPKIVTDGKLVQQITLADATSCVVLTLWENDVNRLDLDESYQ